MDNKICTLLVINRAIDMTSTRDGIGLAATVMEILGLNVCETCQPVNDVLARNAARTEILDVIASVVPDSIAQSDLNMGCHVAHLFGKSADIFDLGNDKVFQVINFLIDPWRGEVDDVDDHNELKKLLSRNFCEDQNMRRRILVSVLLVNIITQIAY